MALTSQVPRLLPLRPSGQGKVIASCGMPGGGQYCGDNGATPAPFLSAGPAGCSSPQRSHPGRRGREAPPLCACPAPPPAPAPAPQHPGCASAVKHSWHRDCFAEGSLCLGSRRDPIGAASARYTAHRQPWTGTGWR